MPYLNLGDFVGESLGGNLHTRANTCQVQQLPQPMCDGKLYLRFQRVSSLGQYGETPMLPSTYCTRSLGTKSLYIQGLSA